MLKKPFIVERQPWQLPEREATPEHLWSGYQRNRRQFIKDMALGAIGAGAVASGMFGVARADNGAWVMASKGLYPARKNDSYQKAQRFPLNSYDDVTHYNNFYEIGSDKSVYRGSDKLNPYPWTVMVDGMVDKPQSFDIVDLIKKMGVETRIYRHRCVEAWSMTLPWSGFPLRKLLALVGVQSSAKYVMMQTAMDKNTMPGLLQVWYPWPYTEGLLLSEAMNDLAFMVVGVYDKPLPNQNGAPLRIALPWKYGFKSIKSIVRITLTDKQPKTFWNVVDGQEYGFFANVNPAFSHPRWSQATERVLGKNDERVPTLIFNGYGEWVAGLYKSMPQDRTLFF